MSFQPWPHALYSHTNGDDPIWGKYIDGSREHYALLRWVLENRVISIKTGLEFGVGSGQSLALIAENMHYALGFDSGLGLPEDWRPEFPAGSFSYGIPDLPHSNHTIVEGLFEKTLPDTQYLQFDRIGLVHIDCDLYSSTKTVLDWIGTELKVGTYVVFDEYYGYAESAHHEQRAWLEFLALTGRQVTAVAHSFEQVAFRIDATGSERP